MFSFGSFTCHNWLVGFRPSSGSVEDLKEELRKHLEPGQVVPGPISVAIAAVFLKQI